MKNIKFIIVGMVLLIGLLTTIFYQVDGMKYKEVDMIKSYDVNYIDIDNVDNTFNSSFSIGKVNSMEHSLRGEHVLIGDSINPRLEMFDYVDGVYEEHYLNLPQITREVLSVDISKDGSRIVVGLDYSPSVNSLYAYINIDDVWTLSDIGGGFIFDDSITSVSFFGDNSEYMIIGGLSDLRVYKYDFDLNKYNEFITDEVINDNIVDIDVYKNYISIIRDNDINVYIFKLDVINEDYESLVLSDNTGNLNLTDIDFSNDGKHIAVASSTGDPYVFRFDNDDITSVVLNNIPTFSNLYTSNFVGNKYIYFGGNDGINDGAMKFKYNNDTGEYDNVTNDITTFTNYVTTLEPVLYTKTLFVGDANGIDLYDIDYTRDDLNIVLPLDYEEIKVVRMDNDIKEYVINDDTLIIKDPTPHTTVYIEYTIKELNDYPLLSLFPLLAVIAIIGGSVAYIKFK